MKISGFTIVRNAIKLNYPVLESILCILSICDEFVVNVGRSDDDTLNLIKSLNDERIKIIESDWDLSRGTDELSRQTNVALNECTGDWAFYLQSDEFIHEKDLPRLKALMQKHLDDKNVEAFRFEWLHFYGSYYRYRDDDGWFQKSDRIIRNNGEIESYEDAYTFKRKDGAPLKRKKTGCLLYHYGWVGQNDEMDHKFNHHKEFGFDVEKISKDPYWSLNLKDLKDYPIYFGSHPSFIQGRIRNHALTREDKNFINRRHMLNPFKIFGFRYKKHRGLIRKSFN